MKIASIGLLFAVSVLSACASNETKTATDETNVVSDRCFATGSNLPRRDCREVKNVDPTRVEMPISNPIPRSAGQM